MSGKQVNNGKAFEYACLDSIYNALSPTQDVFVEKSPQLDTAKYSYNNVHSSLRDKLVKAANAATRVIIRLEPQLEYPEGNKPLILSIQSDARGKAGDVRDVLCLRKQNLWEIGLSCKHNNRAVKHNRLSPTLDFGAEWFGIPCSQNYFEEISPLFDELAEMRSEKILWENVSQKAERFYAPLLEAFMVELSRLDRENPDTIAERLIHYLIGRNDFYKVITNDSRKVTRVEGMNITGSLNRSSAGHSSIISIPKMKLPSRLYSLDYKKVSKNSNSNTTIEVVCDNGWAVSMRIHNAEKEVIPSLKFDVNLISLPNTVHSQVEPW
jgi:hypothetical protein